MFCQAIGGTLRREINDMKTIDEVLNYLFKIPNSSISFFHCQYEAITGRNSWHFNQERNGIKIEISKRHDDAFEAIILLKNEIDKLSRGDQNLKPLLIMNEAGQVSVNTSLDEVFDELEKAPF